MPLLARCTSANASQAVVTTRGFSGRQSWARHDVQFKHVGAAAIAALGILWRCSDGVGTSGINRHGKVVMGLGGVEGSRRSAGDVIKRAVSSVAGTPPLLAYLQVT